MKHLVRFLFALALVWCALVETAEYVAASQFGMEIDGDWVLLLTGSSVAAMGEFVRLYALPLGLAAIGFLTFLVVVWQIAFRSPGPVFLSALVLFGGYAGWNCRTWERLRHWKPLYVAFDTVRGARLYEEIRAAGDWTTGRAAQVRPAPEGATNYVFAIGESMTSYRLSFYGYEKHTTPKLEALGAKLAVLGPVRAPSPYTVRCLPGLFVSDGSSAAVKARQAGYRTAFVGSHHRWARYCSVESSVFAACESKVYLSEVFKGEHIYDDMLMPFVKKAMEGSQPFALFVHLMGSHFQQQDRVRPDYLKDEGLDDYDRSIRLTDEVLADIIKALPPRTTLVYISDHGESTDSETWRTFSSKALMSVPLFVYPAGDPIPPWIVIPPETGH